MQKMSNVTRPGVAARTVQTRPKGLHTPGTSGGILPMFLADLCSKLEKHQQSDML